MTMYIRLTAFLANSSMRNVIREAWSNRVNGWFYVGVGLIVLYMVLQRVLPRVVSEKALRRGRYNKVTKATLAAGLLCIFLSLSLGIGFGFGAGIGSGVGIGSGDGIGIGKSDDKPEERETYVAEGEIDIAITGSTVFVDAVKIPIEKVRDCIEEKDTDHLLVVLIDDFSDYGTYMKVTSILDDILPNGKYEKRKGK